jgi:hypothetical protein
MWPPFDAPGSIRSDKMNYHMIPELPKLAWVASLEMDQGIVSVYHGSAVELGQNWFVEGVWDHDFESGDFHRSENFFGSGVKIEGKCVYFVASSALVDRLFFCHYRHNLLVSNSLILLLSFTGATLDIKHDYVEETNTILQGVQKYKKEFRVVHSEISEFYQLYHQNMVVEDGKIFFQGRSENRKINSYNQYHDLLMETLFRLKTNYESKQRKCPMHTFVTLSSGYDSTAVASLVKNLGVETCYTAKRSNTWIPGWLSRTRAFDDGSRAAETLNLRRMYLDTAPRSISEDELYFLAPSRAEPELVFHSMAHHIEANCAAAVVFTGYHGDKVWDVNLKQKYINNHLIRGDVSGLNLSEIRLKSGFIHVAVPFILAQNVDSLVDISQSDEMIPWKLSTAYDRPIPRRIAEDTGVKREHFGMHKKAVISHYYFPVNSRLRADYFAFLKNDYGISARFVYLYKTLDRMTVVFFRLWSFIVYAVTNKTLALPPTGWQKINKKVVWKDLDLSYLMFIWSVRVLTERTRSILCRYIPCAPMPYDRVNYQRAEYHELDKRTETH